MRRWTKVLIVGFGALALLMPALPAAACSCAYSDARDRLAEADGAIVGTLVESHPVDPPVDNSGEDTIYTFTVDEEVKGDFGETLEVHAPYSGASCGIEVGIGQQTGLFLDQREDGAWASSLCAQIAPEELREAARPLPAPDGEQPVRLIAGGNWGEVDHLALDSQGRTFAYGYGETQGGHLEICPNAERFLQLYQPVWGERGHELRVRSLTDDSIERTVEIPLGKYHSVVELRCLDAQAEEILVAGSTEGGAKGGRIFRISGTEASMIYEGRPLDAVFVDGGTALLSTGRDMGKLKRLDLATGEKSFVALLPLHTANLALSPDGRRVAGFAYNEFGPIVSVGLGSGRVRSNQVARNGCGSVEWNGSEIVYLPGGCDDSRVRVFDARLTEERVLEGDWYTTDNAIVGGVAYGLGWGALYRAPLDSGPAELLRQFPSPELYHLEGIEGSVPIDWPEAP